MKIYVLITGDGEISGIYSTRDKLIAATASTFATLEINRVEEWEIDTGFIEYLRLTKKTTITIED